MPALASLTTKVFLFVTLVLNGAARPITHQMEVENLGICWGMAREMAARAEEGILRIPGGAFTASCQIVVQPGVDH